MNPFKPLVMLSALLGLLCASSALAQLEEVIVTAQKREQSLQDVPMAVTALGAELLDKNEVNSISDLSNLVPSLRFGAGDSPRGASIRIRGVGTDVFSSAVEPNVSVVVDGVPLARTSVANFDFADIQRVEVLRGPQGTLFGKNASAGLVHVITRDPAEAFEGRIKHSVEKPQNYEGEMQKTQFSLSGPLSDGVGARLTGFYKNEEGHIEDIAKGGFMPDSVSEGLRGKLRWDVSPDLMLKLDAEYQDRDGHGGPIVWHSASPEMRENLRPIEPGAHNRQTTTSTESISDYTTDAVTLTVEWQLGDHALTSITGYREFQEFSNTSSGPLDGEHYVLEFNGGLRQMETLTQEIRLTSLTNESLEYTVGALWFQNDLVNDYDRTIRDIPSTVVVGGAAGIDAAQSILLQPLLNAGNIDIEEGFDNTVDTQNLGIFAQATWHPSARWHLTAGVRYIDEEVRVTYSKFQDLYSTSSGAPLAAAGSSSTLEPSTVSDTAVTGTFSAQYDWEDHTVLYSTISRGYRGAAFDLTTNTDQQTLDEPVQPETASSFEIGTKSQLFDNTLELNITAFYTIFKDFQAQLMELTGGVAEVKLDNAGELETKGVEIDVRARPVAPLSIFGSLMYNKAIFNEFTPQCFAGQRVGEEGGRDVDGNGSCDIQDVSGKPLPNAPKWSASLSVRYDHDIGNHTLYTQLTSRYHNRYQAQADQHPNTFIEGKQIWNLRMGYLGLDHNLELAFYVKNLFNKHHLSALIPLSLSNDRRDIVQGVPVDSDRVFGFTAAYKF